jgi:hypothetical protein
VSEGQPSLESMPGGIGDRRIGDPENVSSTHFNSVNSEIPIGEGLWSRGLASRMRKELAEGAKECREHHRRSGIGDS